VQFELIQAVVRPRNPWESIDLGFSMVQKWSKPLYKIWFAFVLPLFLVIYLPVFGIYTLFYESLWVAMLILWWLKPLLDRILLHFLSHALFGEQLTLRQTIKALPRLLFKTRLFLGLTFWRFDFARSFNLPIWQLEGLRGKVGAQRMRLLQKDTRNQAVWFTIVCVHFHAILSLSFFGLVYLMIPVTYEFDFFYVFFYETAWWAEMLRIFSSLFALSIIEPLYVAGGFALYLNRRTQLEGWDIELVFRRIAMQMQNR
jgi:hypothetical protein